MTSTIAHLTRQAQLDDTHRAADRRRLAAMAAAPHRGDTAPNPDAPTLVRRLRTALGSATFAASHHDRPATAG